MNKVLGLILICLTAVPLMAELSPELQEWGDGPAQWIMTSDETRAWRKVATDSDAVNFIDLFWARRDPTPGTALNRFRQEFESRVAYADETFADKRKRGAMTDRGRVYIVMGAATSMNGTVGQSTSSIDSANTSSGGRQLGARHTWLWERADAQKFDMSRIEVVFIEDPVTHRVQRDPHRTDFGRAGPTAIRKAIVSPDLTAVPPWAATGGLHPVIRQSDVEIADDAPAPPSLPEEPVPAPNEGPAVASNTPGVSRLTLLPSGSIDAKSATDPFAGHAETTFKAGRDMPWAMQYCSSKAETPKLTYSLLIAGPLDGKSAEQATRPKDAKLERMTALAGCYVLQGMAPVSKLGPGRYRLSILMDSAAGDIYDIKREFHVQ
jgi:GWxTD domain-containing protein